MTSAAARLAAQLLDALERERDLVVAGAFAELAAEAAARDGQLDRLLALGPDAARAIEAEMAAIRAAAARNAALMKAALDGAAAARRRVAEIAEARERLASYGASGAPVAHATAPRSGRRA